MYHPRFPNFFISLPLSTSSATLRLEEPENTVAVDSFSDGRPWIGLERQDSLLGSRTPQVRSRARE